MYKIPFLFSPPSCVTGLFSILLPCTRHLAVYVLTQCVCVCVFVSSVQVARVRVIRLRADGGAAGFHRLPPGAAQLRLRPHLPHQVSLLWPLLTPRAATWCVRVLVGRAVRIWQCPGDTRLSNQTGSFLSRCRSGTNVEKKQMHHMIKKMQIQTVSNIQTCIIFNTL